MSHYHRVGARLLAPTLLLLIIILLAACGGSSTPQAQTKPTPTPSPSPTPGPGQLLLNKVGQKLSTAKTLHGVFNLTITGQSFSGMVNTEIWNVASDKNRTIVLQSSISQIHTGSVTVTDGKTIWQYDPVENVVYTGPVSATPGSGTATPTSGFVGAGNSQSQSLLNLVQSVFTRSNATLAPSIARVNGHDAYDVHVVPQGVGGFNYMGEIYIDKTTELPLRVDLTASGLGHIVLDIPILVLNQPIADSTFTFVTPPGATVKPLQQATPSSGTLTLAQQQAGYHLLSIPASQTDYELEGVIALGSPGSQIYTLNYIKGNISFTIVQGKPLANLPRSSGEQISIRGTTGTLSTSNDSTSLAWTENGVGIQIQGNLSKEQVVAIASLLS